MDKLACTPAASPRPGWRGAYDPRRAFDPRFAELVQTVIDHTYVDFTTLAAGAQDDARARSTKWPGPRLDRRQALERGLVDRTGGYADALAAAARCAKLRPATPRAVRGSRARPAARLLQDCRRDRRRCHRPPARPAGRAAGAGPGAPAATGAAQDLGGLAEIAERRQPFAAVVHCLCEAP